MQKKKEQKLVPSSFFVESRMGICRASKAVVPASKEAARAFKAMAPASKGAARAFKVATPASKAMAPTSKEASVVTPFSRLIGLVLRIYRNSL